jgi:hypothetical protein
MYRVGVGNSGTQWISWVALTDCRYLAAVVLASPKVVATSANAASGSSSDKSWVLVRHVALPSGMYSTVIAGT